VTANAAAVSGGRTACGESATRALGAADMEAFARDAKIGLLATVDGNGRPHLTLITSIQARAPRELMFGQFTEGLSKAHLKDNPKAGFLIMTPAREISRGTLRWTHQAKAGEDYELYNRKPMFRYNAYCGIHTVHYLDLVALADKARLSVVRLAAGTLALGLVRPLLGTRSRTRVLTPWAERHLGRMATLKFIAWVAEDGYPTIRGPLACRAVDGRRLAFRPVGRDGALDGLAGGRDVAVFAVSMAMESVLVRGPFSGWRHQAGLRVGGLDVDSVYNSMPPKQGQIYPPTPVEPVTEFGTG
jgi:hypothetical protein